ncbi:MAG: type II toxin-antitoxin system YafQ family toxin [Patescibacteria group bacterium]
MNYSVIPLKRYCKALVRLNRRKGFSRRRLEEVIHILQSGGVLPVKHCDHQLTGDLKKYRECHVQPDVLLVYEIRADVLILILVNIGDHQEIFG